VTELWRHDRPDEGRMTLSVSGAGPDVVTIVSFTLFQHHLRAGRRVGFTQRWRIPYAALDRLVAVADGAPRSGPAVDRLLAALDAAVDRGGIAAADRLAVGGIARGAIPAGPTVAMTRGRRGRSWCRGRRIR
jgi:hypothetical protein